MCDGVVQPLTIYHEKKTVEFFPEKKEGTGWSESGYHNILSIIPLHCIDLQLLKYNLLDHDLVPKHLAKMKQNWLKTENSCEMFKCQKWTTRP